MTHVTNNMPLANANLKRLGSIDAGVHTGDEDELVGERRSENVVLEVARVALRSRCDVLPEGGHDTGRWKEVGKDYEVIGLIIWNK